MQAQASEWGQLVQRFCTQLDIPYLIQSVHVADGNLEAQAREARYQAFQQHVLDNEYVVLAHHQQDLAETVVLRLLSGTGVAGLAAMPTFSKRAGLKIFRPFLSWSKLDIQQYADCFHLAYVSDPSNADEHYDRAWARQSLWPLLEQRFPKMQQAIARTNSLMQDANDILNEVLAQDYAQIVQNDVIDLTHLANYSTARQRQVLSKWMQNDAVYRPPLAMIERLHAEVIASRPDAQAKLTWNGQDFIRYQASLYRVTHSAESAPSILTEQSIFMQMQHNYAVLAGRFCNQNAEVGLDRALLGQSLTLRTRQGGERIHLYGRVGHWPLKKAIQTAQIPPWLRNTIQILMKDDVMLGVFTPQGFWLAQSIYCQAQGWLPQRSLCRVSNKHGESNGS